MLQWLRSEVWPQVVITLGQGLIRLLLWTCRVKIEGQEDFLQAAEKGACVLMFWHDRLALIGPLGWRFGSHLAYAAFVSASRDGRLVNAICQSYPHCRIISVAHDGRHHALRELIQQLKERHEVLLITPDGPRGPRHKVKPGVALAARLAKVPVIPFSWSVSRYWQLRTWDQMLFPKPFSTIIARFGAPVIVTGDIDEAYLEKQLTQLSDMDLNGPE